MSLPRTKALERRRYQRQPAPTIEPDHDVVMPAISRLRAAGELHHAVIEALDSIPPHLLPRVVGFAGERHKILKWDVMRFLLDRIGFGALADDIGSARASVIWHRYQMN